MAFNQREYINKFNKHTYKMISIRIRKDSSPILEKLYSVESINNYIISLIEDDVSHDVLTLKEIKNIIKPIMNKYGIREIYLFGSYARGEANKNSDVDIYCERGNIKTFLDQGKLEEELISALGKDVDIIFIGTKLDSYLKTQLEEDLIKLC